MSSQVQIYGIIINRSGLHEVMNSTGVQSELLKHANRIADATGKRQDYRADVQAGKTRAHGRVATNSTAAFMRERYTNRLLKSMGSGKP